MFTPSRNKQWFCGKDTGRNCAQTSKARQVIAQLARERGASLDERACQKCRRPYKPHSIDQKTCGPDCPGKPEQRRICANPDCQSPDRAFTVPGNGVGKGLQIYCTKRCRDQVGRSRQGQRFRKYEGMTREEYERRGDAQTWRCLICGRRPEPDPRRRNLDPLPRLQVDHCHTTQQLRDLLCNNCNLALGLFTDSPELLSRAIDYIIMWRHVHAKEHVIIPDYFENSNAVLLNQPPESPARPPRR
jgi:recombination endonuclease VII